MTGRATYNLKLNFRPSRHKVSNWVIIDHGDSSELVVEVSNRYGKKSFEIATKIGGSSSEKIHGTCEGMLRSAGNWERRVGLDGIAVGGAYQSQTLGELHFSFWSPKKGDQLYELIEAVFESLAKVNLGEDWDGYFEQLRMYFKS